MAQPSYRVLDADDATLVRRYKESRRSHPLAKSGLPLDGIKLERKLLEEIKGRADTIYNTTNLKPKELREKLLLPTQIVARNYLPLTSFPSDLSMDYRLMQILFLMSVFYQIHFISNICVTKPV